MHHPIIFNNHRLCKKKCRYMIERNWKKGAPGINVSSTLKNPYKNSEITLRVQKFESGNKLIID